MQAVILAAGESSRFWPFNGVHKSLVKIMGKPIILYTAKGLVDSGIKDIIIIQGPNKGIERELDNYTEYSKYFKYISQNEPNGMGDALSLAKEFLVGQFLLVSPGRVDCEEIVRKLNPQITSSKSRTILVGAKTDEPSLFGILKLDNNRVVGIVEKPKDGEEPSDIKAMGIYVLTPDFFDVYKKVKRHQYDFEEALSLFMKKHDVGLILWDNEAPSLKYPWHLLDMRNYLFNKYLNSGIGKNAKIAQSAEMIGNVLIGRNVSILEKAVIKGPCYIGDNVLIGNNAVLRNGVDLEENSVIGANMEIKNTLLMENSKVHSGFIGDSVIGRNCRIGAGFNSANVRLDRETVKSTVKNERVDTGLKNLGVMVGDDTRIGIKSSSMPGVIIGRKVTIGSNTSVVKNVADNTKYYTKFQEIIVKK